LTSPTGNPDGLLTHAPWQIIVLTFSIIVFMTVIVSVFAVYIIPKIKSMQKKNDKLVSLTREDIAGIKTIKSFGSYKYHGEKFNGISDDIRGLNVRINSINNLSTPAVNMLLSCLTIGIY
jgi:ATP-binding cassette subfamily B protein